MVNKVSDKDMFYFVKEVHKQGLKEDEILEFENTYNIKFPEILREFYLKFSSISLKTSAFIMYDHRLSFHVQHICFLSGITAKVSSEMNRLEVFKRNEIIPKTFVPLAETYAGGLFCWDSESGKVYFFGRANMYIGSIAIEELETDTIEKGSKYVYICESIEEFFSILNSASRHFEETGNKDSLYVVPAPGLDELSQIKDVERIERSYRELKKNRKASYPKRIIRDLKQTVIDTVKVLKDKRGWSWDGSIYEFLIKKEDNIEIPEEYLNEFEEKYNIKFPDILRKFYLEYNRAGFKTKDGTVSFVMYSWDYKFCVRYFYPLAGVHDCVEHNMELIRERIGSPNNVFSETFIPLAEDYDGIAYYWDTVDGKVYCAKQSWSKENALPISDSIEGFFKLLAEAAKHEGKIAYIAEPPKSFMYKGEPLSNEFRAKIRKGIEKGLSVERKKKKQKEWRPVDTVVAIIMVIFAVVMLLSEILW